MYGSGAFDGDLLQGACDWLQTVGTADGAVGPALPDALEYPRADHWNGDWAVTPSLNPTAAIAGYTMTPLHFPRGLFDETTLEAHLDDLVARQQDDGGWPVLWEAPGAAATAEWRGRWTLDALVTLRSFGRS